MCENNYVICISLSIPCVSTNASFVFSRLALRHERNRKPDKPDDFVCYESSDDEAETETEGKQFLRTSFNFVDYVRARETNTREVRKINQEYG